MIRTSRTLLSLVLLLAAALPLSAERQRGVRAEQTLRAPASVTGVVATVSGSLVTVMDGSVALDTAGARFESRRGDVSAADLKPGTRIHAVIDLAGFVAGAPLKAVGVVILDAPDGSLLGPVTQVDAGGRTLSLLGQTIRVTSDTVITGGRGEPKSAADLVVGDLVMVDVEVHGGVITAERIQILTAPPAPSTAEGVVKSIGREQWVITRRDGTDLVVLVSAQTRIDPAATVGSMVHVIGNLDGNGNLVAAAIVVRPVPPQAVTLEGTVKSISPEVWVITLRERGDVRVAVTPQTTIQRGLQPGDAVVVRAIIDGGGGLTALAIASAPPPPPPTMFRFEGVVRSIGPSEWVIGEAKVLVMRETKIIGNPAVGDRVLVTGVRMPDSFMAASIEKLSR